MVLINRHLLTLFSLYNKTISLEKLARTGGMKLVECLNFHDYVHDRMMSGEDRDCNKRYVDHTGCIVIVHALLDSSCTYSSASIV